MDAVAFLRKILPPSGVYYSATPKSFVQAGKTIPYFAHQAFSDIADLAEHMLAHDAVGTTMYHACSAFKEEFYLEFDTARGKERKRTRTFKNMRSAKAFWTDLDCGLKPDGTQKDYPDQKAALADLGRFYKAAGLPTPMIVLSGYGVHAYWPLETELLATSWREAADLLKKTMIAHGLKLDPTRGADGASVLRTPGTHNWKDQANPKPVRLLLDQPVINTERMVTLIRAAAKRSGIKDLGHKPTVFESVVEVGDTGGLPAGDADKIALSCAHMGAMRDTKGDIPEPLWYATLGVLAYCEGGNEKAHEWSSGHSDYDADFTERKIVQWIAATTGPATCSYFESKGGADKCATCAFKGKVSTPLQLGIKVVEAPKADADGEEIHPPPFPYVRAADGLYVVIDKIADIKKKFYESDVYVSDIVRHPMGYEVAVVHYNRPHMGWEVLQGKTSLFNKQDTAWQWFSDNGIYIKSKENAEVMAMYMRSYLAELHQRKQALSSYTNLGWKEDGSFLAGQVLIAPDGQLKPNKVITQTIPVTKHMKPVGELAPWIELTKVFNEPEMHLLGFGLLVGAGSPLCVANGINAGALNLVGPTGCGKSSVQRMILSMYGDPARLIMNAKDTNNAIMKRVGVMNNICVCIDEVGNIEAKRASDMILQLTQGKDKETLMQNREERHANEWNMAPVFSSNHRLASKISDLKADTGAESARLLETSIVYTDYFRDVDKARHFNETLQKNYGKPGLLFAKKMVQTGDRGAALLREAERMLEQAGMKFLAHERFIRALFVVALGGGLLGQRNGLFLFDPIKCCLAAYSQLLQQRGEIEKDRMDSIDLISLFTNQHFDKIISVEYGYQPQPIITHDTKGGEIMGRISVHKNKKGEVLRADLAISISEFRTWVNRKMGSLGEVRKELLLYNALLADATVMVLGKGTQYHTPGTRCMVINMMHPRLRSAIEKDGDGYATKAEMEFASVAFAFDINKAVH